MKKVLSSLAVLAGGVWIAVAFQNCTLAKPATPEGLAPSSFASAFSAQSLTPDQQIPQTMVNTIEKTADGRPNPAYGKIIRNIIVTQAAGWSGLPGEAAANPNVRKPDAPLFGGQSSYLSKNPALYDKQARMIAALGDHMAAAVLLMDKGDSSGSGYGACWNGVWVKDRVCNGGSGFQFPQQLYSQFKQAALNRGLQVVPDFSIMNWEQPNAYDGARFLPKLQALLTWVRPTLDNGNVRTIDGKWVIIIDSLPETAGLSPAQKRQVYEYMASQTDIFWLDNAVSPIDGPLVPNAGNIMGAGWGSLAAQKTARKNWGNRFLHWVSVLKQAQPDYSLAQDPKYQESESDLQEEMNLIDYRADKYPVVLSQWNEYAESLYFEPAEKIGFTNYNRLKAWVSRQGPDPVPFVPAQASDFADPVNIDYVGIVTKAYKDILERAPDQEGLDYYVGAMKSGQSEAQVRQSLSGSYEYTFKGYYKTYLLRLPTLAEIVQNNADLKSGKITLAQLQDSLRKSPECKAQCVVVVVTPATDYAAIVTKAYKEILERAPDQAGLDYYVGEMKKSLTEAQMRQSLLDSYEYSYKGYYKTYLLRLPTLAEIVQNNADLKSGKITLAQLQEKLRKSSECKSQCLTTTTTTTTASTSSGQCPVLAAGQWSIDSFGNSPRTRVSSAAACQAFCNSNKAICCTYTPGGQDNCTAFNTVTCKDPSKWQIAPQYPTFQGSICK